MPAGICTLEPSLEVHAPAILDELASAYGVRCLIAMLERANFRSLALLRKLGFGAATATQAEHIGHEPDELVFLKVIATVDRA